MKERLRCTHHAHTTVTSHNSHVASCTGIQGIIDLRTLFQQNPHSKIVLQLHEINFRLQERPNQLQTFVKLTGFTNMS